MKPIVARVSKPTNASNDCPLIDADNFSSPAWIEEAFLLLARTERGGIGLLKALFTSAADVLFHEMSI
jgi:hypothetical protein